MGIKIVQISLILWLLSGFSFLTCIFVCIFVNVGYVSFRSSGNTVLVVFAFTFISFLLWSLYRSIFWTFIKMCRSIALERFGAGRRDFILLRWFDDVQKQEKWEIDGFDESAEIPDDPLPNSNSKFEYRKTFILSSVLFCFLGLPLIVIAVIYGYWTIINIFCSILTIVSATVILVTNFISRVVRFFSFLVSLCFGNRAENSSKPSQRLLASYLAFAGHDHGRSIIDKIAESALILISVVAIFSVVFSNFKINIWAMSVIVSAAISFVLVRLRHCFPTFQRLGISDSSETLDDVGENNEISNSANSLVRALSTIDLSLNGLQNVNFGHVILVFSLRCLTMLVGFATLVYMDLKQVRTRDGKPPIEGSLNEISSINLLCWTLGFVIITVLKDLMYFTPLYPYVRFSFLLILQISQFLLALICRFWFTSFTFTAQVILSIYEMNYRDAKRFWNCRAIPESKVPNKKRATRNAFIIIYIVGGSIFLSILLGFAVSTLRTFEHEIKNPEYRERLRNPPPIDIGNPSFGKYVSPRCQLGFSEHNLTLIDLGIMSDAVYQPDPKKVLSIVHLNPNLNNWTIGWYALDRNGDSIEHNHNRDMKFTDGIKVITGVRFVEYVNKETNISVVAIRGTHSVEDIFQDLYVWFTPFLLQVSTYFGTLVSLWPSNTVANVVYIINKLGYPNLVYWGEMESIIEKIRDSKSGKSADTENTNSENSSPVVLTGHSMGGGIASIIGAHLSIPSVVYSAPGLGYSMQNYKLSTDSVMSYVTNVEPQEDPVPGFDKQIGRTERIACHSRSPVGCHMIGESIMTLMSECGIPRNKNTSQ